jgi:hypothetical protein
MLALSGFCYRMRIFWGKLSGAGRMAEMVCHFYLAHSLSRAKTSL